MVCSTVCAPFHSDEKRSVFPSQRVSAMVSFAPGSPRSVRVTWRVRLPPSESGDYELVTSDRFAFERKSAIPMQLDGALHAEPSGFLRAMPSELKAVLLTW